MITEYNAAVIRLAEVTFMRTLANADAHNFTTLQQELAELQETMELMCDTFGQPMHRLEEDVLDAMDHLPVDDMVTSHQLAIEGALQ